MEILVIGSIAVLIAGMVQVLSGFGFALVSIPLLMAVFPGYHAVLIGMILSLIALGLQAAKDWQFTRWDIVWKLTAVGLLGIVLGVTIGRNLNGAYLKSIVGITVLIYVLIEWFLKGKKQNAKKSLQAQEDQALKKQKKPHFFYTAGIIAGLLTGVVGMPGPPVVAVLVNYLKTDAFRATLVVYFFINMVIALTLALSLTPPAEILSIMKYVIYLIIPTMIGYLFGYPLRKFINEKAFKQLVFVMLILIAVSSMVQAYIG